jgi:hypothetical protein
MARVRVRVVLTIAKVNFFGASIFCRLQTPVVDDGSHRRYQVPYEDKRFPIDPETFSRPEFDLVKDSFVLSLGKVPTLE